MPRTPSAAAAQIGARITASRTARSMTVDQLAVASRIDSSNIRSYESGRAMMNVHSLVRIAEALNVDPGELLDGVVSDMFERERV
ncbi:helix-turn-helix domain-containing protein [Microbacterium sp. NPDC056234]|uniref:helix-turn-helix domain-containing protein n=1 Tax=Microbacterium sp. NPDC056234 TaxID=3345757 RepID=UPI0035DE3875